MPPILDAPRAFQQLLPAAGQLSGRMPGSAVDKLQRPGTGSAVRSLSTPFRKTPVGRAETTAAITAIWQRHLRRSPIRPDENFFDLGGDRPGIADHDDL